MRTKILVLLLLFSFSTKAQTPSGFFYPAQTYDSNRGNGLFLTESIAFTGAILALHYLWYKKYKHSRFHFFNDNAEWLQMDKLGHATTAYNLGVLGMDVYRWTGMEQSKATWLGGVTGLLFLTTIEVFDGFSSGWGFSAGDMLANSGGAALAIGQSLGWGEQRMQLKFSYHKSIYAPLRPDELGANGPQRVLKDYNGQSYWLSVNVASFLDKNTSFPKWINAAFGYGAEGMVRGRVQENEEQQPGLPAFARTRKFFFSADVDLTRIALDKGFETSLAKTLNFIKIPAPALGFTGATKKLKFYPFYY